MFKDARNDAEARIYNQINEKVDAFFELGKFLADYGAFFEQSKLRQNVNE